MTGSAGTARSARVFWARLKQQIGWAGMAGTTVVMLSAAILAAGWTDRQSARKTMAQLQSADAVASRVDGRSRQSAPPSSSTKQELPAPGDLPSLLARIEAIAVANNLGWAAADYRAQPASEHAPASLEIRTRFMGTYPQIRHLVTEVLERVPAVTFRQFSVMRPSSDSDQVEVKIVFAILLRDAPATFQASSSKQDSTTSVPMGAP